MVTPILKQEWKDKIIMLKINTQILLERAQAKIAADNAAKQAEGRTLLIPQLKPIIPINPIKLNIGQSANELMLSETEKEESPIVRTNPILGLYGIDYTEAQKEFILRGAAGESLCLFGAAGTGKTTSLKGLIKLILRDRSIPSLIDANHKHLISGLPGIVITSYMNRTVYNDKKVIPELSSNCVTLHKLLEYSPVWNQVENPETGKYYNKMSFEPKRGEKYKLDEHIKIIIIDEAGNTPVDLFRQLLAALPNPEEVQFIFMGDLYQVPPVFGAAILGIKGHEMKENRVVLTEVKRQAKDSPILTLATHIRQGNEIPAKELENWNLYTDSTLTIKPWKRTIDVDMALHHGVKGLMESFYNSGEYDPFRDIIIMLQNINFGIEEVNRIVAQFLATRESKEVYEIIAGFNKYYYSIGDAVFYAKDDFLIEKIDYNPQYDGLLPQRQAKTLNYWGFNSVLAEMAEDIEAHINAQLDKPFAEEEERKQKSSHVITLRHRLDTERTIELSTAKEINDLRLGYACTVHRALGSEWERVYFLMHHSNKSMLYRELLYTGITRAQKHLTIICEPDTFVKGVRNQKIPGESVEEKLVYFQDRPVQIPRLKK